MSKTLLELINIVKHFPIKNNFYIPYISPSKTFIQAVDDVTLNISEGETLAVVGESGCGKTTIARIIMKFIKPTKGIMKFNNMDVSKIKGKNLKELRSNIQMVFQDPDSSLDPKIKIIDSVKEPISELTNFSKSEIKQKVISSLKSVGLNDEFLYRYPNQLSGGQKQRVSIARAISLQPKLIILDEPTSALDVSVQAQILELLIDLQKKFNLSYIFITHNIAVAQYIADKIVVMYSGKIVEIGNVDQVMTNPRHPYTIALISSTPKPNPWKRRILKTEIIGEVPSAINPPSGCRFNNRCPYVEDICYSKIPKMIKTDENHLIACHFPEKTLNITKNLD